MVFCKSESIKEKKKLPESVIQSELIAADDDDDNEDDDDEEQQYDSSFRRQLLHVKESSVIGRTEPKRCTLKGKCFDFLLIFTAFFPEN